MIPLLNISRGVQFTETGGRMEAAGSQGREPGEVQCLQSFSSTRLRSPGGL